MAERLVRLGHLDRLLPLGHRLALAAGRGHQFVGQPEVRRPAGLAADGGEQPADRQRLLAERADLLVQFMQFQRLLPGGADGPETLQ